MKQDICFKIFLEIMPLFIGVILSYFFWRNSILLAFFYIIAIGIILKVKYRPGDFHALILGLVTGLFIEITGASISRYQSFANPDFLGIPIWLPIAWAYGLMLMKRVGVIIYEYRK